jgi:hypothetical protein
LLIKKIINFSYSQKENSTAFEDICLYLPTFMIIAITVIYLNEQSNSNQQVSTCNNKRIDCEDDYDSRNWEHIYDEVKYQNINVLKDKFQGIPFGIHV